MAAANARRHIDDPAFRADLLRTLDDAVARLRELLEQLRRDDRGELREVDLVSLLARARGSRPHRRPRLAAAPPSLVARVDTERLLAAVRHLIDNGFEATQELGPVELGLRAERGLAVIEVRDRAGPDRAAGLLARLWRPPPDLAAQVVDLRFGCADRLATAVEMLTGRHRPTALADAVVADAARAAAVLDLRSGLPVRPPGLMALAVGVALLAAAAEVLLAGRTVPGTPARAVVETIRREGRRLEHSARLLEEQARLDRARVTRRLAPSLRALGQSLQRERLDRRDALARLEALTRQVEAARHQVQRRMAEVTGQTPAPTERPANLFRRRAAAERTLRQIREIADRLAQSRSPEERRALLQELAALAGEIGRAHV